jgi:hypothetical protein
VIPVQVHSESTAERRRGSQARVGMRPAAWLDKSLPLSKIIIGTGLDTTDLVSSGQGAGQESEVSEVANNLF